MRELLRAARAKLAAEGLADRYRIGITSAYRPATRQFEIWQGRTFAGKSTGGGFPYYYEKAIENGLVRAGDYSRAAAKKVVEFFGGCIASPGYSNHQDGLAFDLGTGLVGKGLGKIGSGSWFHTVAGGERPRLPLLPAEHGGVALDVPPAVRVVGGLGRRGGARGRCAGTCGRGARAADSAARAPPRSNT